MEGGVGPLRHLHGMAVLDRIVMDVVDVPMQVGVVANQMFPVTPLPKADFLAQSHARRDWVLDGVTYRLRGPTFDERPSAQIVRIAFLKLPYRMHVV